MGVNTKIMIRIITLAMGCSWGGKSFFDLLPGVLQVRMGYANGYGDKIQYIQVKQGNTGFAEACEIKYEDEKISTLEILNKFFNIIDPTSYNRQGNNCGNMYRTGIYYDYYDKKWIIPIIEMVLANQQTKYNRRIVVEVQELTKFILADSQQQEYLQNHNGIGKCHIDFTKVLI